MASDYPDILHVIEDCRIPVPWSSTGYARCRVLAPFHPDSRAIDQSLYSYKKPAYDPNIETVPGPASSNSMNELPHLGNIENFPLEPPSLEPSRKFQSLYIFGTLYETIPTNDYPEPVLCVDPRDIQRPPTPLVPDKPVVSTSSSGRQQSNKKGLGKPRKQPSKKPLKADEDVDEGEQPTDADVELKQCLVPDCGELVRFTVSDIENHASSRHGLRGTGQSHCKWPGCGQLLRPDSFRRHMLPHFAKKETCPLCGLIVARKDSLKRHMDRHSENNDNATTVKHSRRPVRNKRSRDASSDDVDDDDEYIPRKKKGRKSSK